MEDDVVEKWGKALAKFGAPTVIAVWFVWWLTSVITPQLAAMRLEIAEIKSTVVPVSDYMQRMSNVQLQSCINQAKDRDAKDRCFDSVYRTPQRSDVR